MRSFSPFACRCGRCEPELLAASDRVLKPHVNGAKRALAVDANFAAAPSDRCGYPLWPREQRAFAALCAAAAPLPSVSAARTAAAIRVEMNGQTLRCIASALHLGLGLFDLRHKVGPHCLRLQALHSKASPRLGYPWAPNPPSGICPQTPRAPSCGAAGCTLCVRCLLHVACCVTCCTVPFAVWCRLHVVGCRAKHSTAIGCM